MCYRAGTIGEPCDCGTVSALGFGFPEAFESSHMNIRIFGCAGGSCLRLWLIRTRGGEMLN